MLHIFLIYSNTYNVTYNLLLSLVTTLKGIYRTVFTMASKTLFTYNLHTATEALTCSFEDEDGLCSWTQGINDTSPFILDSTDMVTAHSTDHPTYVYANVSGSEDKFSLNSPTLYPNMDDPYSYCFSFW